VEGQPLLLQNLGQQQQGQLIEAIHKAALTEVRPAAMAVLLELSSCAHRFFHGCAPCC
jgi:hypothetical protein